MKKLNIILSNGFKEILSREKVLKISPFFYVTSEPPFKLFYFNDEYPLETGYTLKAFQFYNNNEDVNGNIEIYKATRKIFEGYFTTKKEFIILLKMLGIHER